MLHKKYFKSTLHAIFGDDNIDGNKKKLWPKTDVYLSE